MNGQTLLFDLIFEPEVQIAFNNRKGGIPLLKGIEPSRLDSCARELYTLRLNKKYTALVPADIVYPVRRAAFIQGFVRDAWKKNDSPATVVDALIREANQSLIEKQ